MTGPICRVCGLELGGPGCIAARKVTSGPAVLAFDVGGYTSRFHRREAGPFGCDPCAACDGRPAEGATVWMNNYHDLYCDPCAQARSEAWRKAPAD